MKLQHKIFQLIAFTFLLSVPAWSVTRHGSCSASTTSCTLSAASSGDLVLVWAVRKGSATSPSLVSGWTSIATGHIGSSTTELAWRIACEVSTGSTSTGTWTNAGIVAAITYSNTGVGTTANCNTTGVGANTSGGNAGSATMSYTALTLQDTTGNSWVTGFGAGSADAPCVPSALPSVTSIGTSPGIIAGDTNAGVASWSAATCSITSTTWATYVLEIKPLDVTLPSYNNGTGTYNNDVSVTITVSSPAGATICYTTDGSTPTATVPGTCANGTTYSTPVSITATGTVLKAIGTKLLDENSGVQSATYTLTVATPSYDHGTGTYNNDTAVTISDTTTSSSISYCTDTVNTCTPGTGGTSVTITATATYLRASATKSNYNTSAVQSALYTLTVGAVTDSPGAGTYMSIQSATLATTTTTGATIYYTTDNSTATCSSTTYSSPISITVTSHVRAVSCKTNYVTATEINDLYTINLPTGVASLLPLMGVGLGGGGISVSGGWTFLQERQACDTNAVCSTTATTCSTVASSCTIDIFSTTAGTAMYLTLFTGANVTISSVSGGTGTWNLCPASACHYYDSGTTLNVDSVYNVTGTGGDTSYTLNFSGNTATVVYIVFAEALPPECGASVCVPSFDGGAVIFDSSCSTACAMAAPTISATDWVFHNVQAANSSVSLGNFQNVTAPYYSDFYNAAQGYNVNSGTTPPTYNQGTPAAAFLDSAIAFKSSGGTFTASPPVLYSLKQAPPNTTIGCNPNCSITIPSTGSGNLLWLNMVGDNTSSQILSVSGGGTWGVPTGTHTCQIYSASLNNSLSCGYVLSSSSGTTIINITATGNGNFFWDYIEVSRSSGSFVLDTQDSTNNSTASSQPVGQALTLSGTNDVCIQAIEAGNGLPNSQTLYFLPLYGGGGNNNIAGLGSSAILLNTTHGNAPTWQNSASEQSIVYGICFK